MLLIFCSLALASQIEARAPDVWHECSADGIVCGCTGELTGLLKDMGYTEKQVYKF